MPGGVRVLGVAQGRDRAPGGAQGPGRQPHDRLAVLEGAAGVLRRPRARRHQPRRPVGARPHLRAQDQDVPGDLHPPAGRRAVAVPGWRSSSCRRRASPARGGGAARGRRALLASIGLEPGGEQQTKTKAALQFFSNELQAAAPLRPPMGRRPAERSLLRPDGRRTRRRRPPRSVDPARVDQLRVGGSALRLLGGPDRESGHPELDATPIEALGRRRRRP